MNYFTSFLLGALFDEHFAYLTFRKVYCVDPGSWTRRLNETILGHVKDWDHISMRHKHMHWKVHYLGIDLEVFGNTVMQNSVPFGCFIFQIWFSETDSISPKVENLPNLKFKFVQICFMVNYLCSTIVILWGTRAPATASWTGWSIFLFCLIVDKL